MQALAGVQQLRFDFGDLPLKPLCITSGHVSCVAELFKDAIECHPCSFKGLGTNWSAGFFCHLTEHQDLIEPAFERINPHAQRPRPHISKVSRFFLVPCHQSPRWPWIQFMA